MNREIKFRAWDKKKGGWSKNILVDVDGVIWYQFGESVQPIFENDFTISQFTGLKDKNGAEIFEGDIIKQKHGAHCKVFWNSGGFWITNDDGTPHGHIPLAVTTDFEVIGNIFENPELLKS